MNEFFLFKKEFIKFKTNEKGKKEAHKIFLPGNFIWSSRVISIINRWGGSIRWTWIIRHFFFKYK